MAIDWDAVKSASDNTQKFKNYAPNGEYTVKFEKATVVDKEGWKSPAVEFEWQESDEYKFSKSPRHWLSLGNPNWRVYHVLCILKELGIGEDSAKKLLESAETDDRAKLVKNYQDLFNRAAQKHPEVKVVVRTQMRDGKPVLSASGLAFSETEFATPGAGLAPSMPKATEPQPAADELFGDDVLTGEDNEEIPF